MFLTYQHQPRLIQGIMPICLPTYPDRHLSKPIQPNHTISQTPLLTYQPIHSSLPRSTPIEAHPVQPKHISDPPPHTSTYPHQPTPINTYRSPSSLNPTYLRTPSFNINLSTPAYPDQHLLKPIQSNHSISKTPLLIHLPIHTSRPRSTPM